MPVALANWQIIASKQQGFRYEADISTQRSEAQAKSRFSCPDGNEKRPQGTGASQSAGPPTPVGLSGLRRGLLGPMPAFPPTARLSTPGHYQRVFDAPTYKVSSRAFLLLAQVAEAESSRLGVIVAKKHIRRASHRNRVKRLVREHFRLTDLSVPLDLVVLAKAAADQMDNARVREDLSVLWQKLERATVAS